jgi:hypothetical protein
VPNEVNPFAGLSASPVSATRSEGDTRSATFDVTGIRLEITAAPGAARLVVSSGDDSDVYLVEPAELAGWATATMKLLSLQPAEGPADRVEVRAPFLFDRDGRPSIAFEALASEQGFGYLLLVSGAAEMVAGFVTTAEVLRGVAQAAAGAGTVARPAS